MKGDFFNNNPFDNPRRITEDDIMMERIQKAKKRIEEDERLLFKISSDTDAREIVHHFSQALERIGIDIEIRYTDDLPFLTSSTRGFGMSQMMDIYIKRISDQNLRRMLEIEDSHKKFTGELREHGNREPMITLREHKNLIDKLKKESDKKTKSKSKSKKGISIQNRKLVKKSDGQFEWSEGKSFEEARNEPKSTEYQEKIKWFCEKYKQDYEIIYESFKDDDLDNLIWKGEKVEFPKK